MAKDGNKNRESLFDGRRSCGARRWMHCVKLKPQT